MEIIKKNWSEDELLNKIINTKAKIVYLKENKLSSKEHDDKLSIWEEKLQKLKK